MPSGNGSSQGKPKPKGKKKTSSGAGAKKSAAAAAAPGSAFNPRQFLQQAEGAAGNVGRAIQGAGRAVGDYYKKGQAERMKIGSDLVKIKNKQSGNGNGNGG